MRLVLITTNTGLDCHGTMQMRWRIIWRYSHALSDQIAFCCLCIKFSAKPFQGLLAALCPHRLSSYRKKSLVAMSTPGISRPWSSPDSRIRRAHSIPSTFQHYMSHGSNARCCIFSLCGGRTSAQDTPLQGMGRERSATSRAPAQSWLGNSRTRSRDRRPTTI
ncbi:uncharacterized protein B0H18DRAFT_487775 [Fomitopsis serialis]|uniref:uncharacterized protein n=1 Tax=Fomitopsis serialis TaxID=139415 RepID=UPI0020076659|nr:uncharacterized protein B0H18DRAFT_487775 [Neoantrodia serialis]KAH9934785.1 hypothetical protein B0H18DRAFT_487775 [Neoantrodia serialis]